MSTVTLWLAFAAGVLSFISPCCLPMYPSYISYITGISVAQLKESSRPREVQKLTLFHTLFFILGFSIIFYALGFTFSAVGRIFTDYREMIRMLGAILIIVMGLFVMEIFKPQFLMRQKKLEIPRMGFGYLGSMLVGIGFAAGWTPCIGPILVSILSLAAAQPERAFAYMTAYTLGFAIPFFIMAFFVGRARWILKYSNRVMKIGGALMIFFGILLYTNQMTVITSWASRLFGGFTGF